MASKFVWYELHTSDATAAGEFYAKALGWSARDAGMPYPYLVVSAGERMVGGLLEKELTGRPMWVGYVGVAKADEAAEAIVAAGGTMHTAPEDIPGIGRFAVVADPQGAIFVAFQPYPVQPAPETVLHQPGTFGWSELSTTDWTAAWTFYEEQFGWKKGTAVDMKEFGVYQTFHAGAEDIGAMMTRFDPTAAPVWLYYVNVEDVDATGAKIREAGGRVVHGPMVVAGGQRVSVCADAQGAAFGIVAPR